MVHQFFCDFQNAELFFRTEKLQMFSDGGLDFFFVLFAGFFFGGKRLLIVMLVTLFGLGRQRLVIFL